MSTVWQEVRPGTWAAQAVPPGRLVPGEEIGVPGIGMVGLRGRGAVLLVRSDVWARVNGEPVLGGVRLLEHRDEVMTLSARLCFSAESTPVVREFPAAADARAPVCPVCRGPVRPGMQAVQCPGCGRWFHQLDATADRPAKPCWTYAPACRFCNHPTAFDDSAAWRPDREENLAK